MYESFFGLKCEPFSVAPDPRFLYMSEKHREALEHLNYGLGRGSGFVLLTGEIGAGKTTVWRAFLDQLPSHVDVAYVGNPKLDIDGLLARIAEDLNVPQPETPRPGQDLIDAIHGQLLLAHASGRRALVVVDEAQALSPAVMEQLRLLTNLVVSSDRRLLQVLLIGQPELRTMLEQPALEPVNQRVVARYHLSALSEDETAHYIEHRMKIAGLLGALPFEPHAVERVHAACRGVPRRINVLCDRALLLAHQARLTRVPAAVVEQASIDVFGPRRRPPSPAGGEARTPSLRPVWMGIGAGAATAVAAAGVMAVLWWPGERPSAKAAPPSAAPIRSEAPTASTPPSVATLPIPHAASAQLVSAPAAAPVPPLPTLHAAEDADHTAWRELAALWGAQLPAGDPCEAAPQQGLQCFRVSGGLPPIRQLGRPGILTLTDDHGHQVLAVLVALGEERATLRINGAEQTLPLSRLARAWRGDFATLWRAPEGYHSGQKADQSPALAQWLDERLSKIEHLEGVAGGRHELAQRVFAFQLAHGLPPDGVAGPLTMMQINRASGVDEAKLKPLS
jgi:general secretion pathway protein A